MRRSSQFAGVALLLSIALTRPARGDNAQRDPGAADVLFREGRKAMQAGNYALACPKFQESYRLDPAGGTLLNLGDCEEKQRHLAVAWQYFREAEQRLGTDDRAKIAKQRWEAVETRLAFVTFTLPPNASPDTKVMRGSVELGAASLGVPLPLDPGTHVVRIRAPGASEARIELSLKSGERRDVRLEIGAPAAPGGATASETDAAPPSRRPSVAPYVAFGVGGVGLVMAAIGTWQVLDAKSGVDGHCTNGVCDPDGLDAASRGKTFNVVATVGGIVAIAGIATGTVLLLTTPKKAAAVVTWPVLGGAALGATGRF